MRGFLSGFPVQAHAASTVDDHVKKPAGHHQILVEMDHVALVADRKMDAKGGAHAEKSKQSSGPPGIEAHEQCSSAEYMDQHRDPDRNAGNRYMHFGEILCRGARVPQLQNAIP